MTLLGDEDGPQHFMTSYDLTDAALQCGDIEFTAEANGAGNVICGASAFELVQEPQSLLRKRERQGSIAIDSLDVRSYELLDLHRSFDLAGEFTQRGCFKHTLQWQLDLEALPHARDHLHGK
nr:hypothetical protein [uncultured bacterium]